MVRSETLVLSPYIIDECKLYFFTARKNMALKYPDDLKYLDTHEYIRLEGEIATIGITGFAVDQLGDIVFLELPEVGTKVEKGETFGNVESVKAVEDLKAPVTGTVIERNDAIVESPENLAEDPYAEGWLLKVRVDNPSEADDALSASKYRQMVEGE
jgi:glycine cleavage system H protein